MKLSEKIRYLREVEGNLRGLNRAMTQQELVRAIQSSAEPRKKTGASSSSGKGSISQSYLSQIESGARPHLTNTSRMLLARFFQVHPGYLVDDPAGYRAELISDLETREDKLDLWLIGGAERFHKDSELCHALLTLSRHEDSRRCVLLLESILETPALVDRLLQVLRPEDGQPLNAADAERAASCDEAPLNSATARPQSLSATSPKSPTAARPVKSRRATSPIRKAKQ